MTGLTKQQVEERIERGEVNKNDNPVTRSYKQIFLKNIFTFFNFLNVVLLVLVLFVKSYKNSMFMGIIIINTIIGIVQEVRAKKIIDDLAIMTASKSMVLRDGIEEEVPVDQLVLGDVLVLKTGDQVPADASVIQGEIEVNESLLTGESDNLLKKPGDELYSGSFVTAGQAYCKIVHVGADSYVAKITQEAKQYKKHNSELRNSLNVILKMSGIIILPIGISMFYKQYYIEHTSLEQAIVPMVSAVLGMIPEGLILLTSVALTIGSMTLARKKTLVQELYCIETLARVDTLCLDKTGTITEGSMKVENIQILPENITESGENPQIQTEEGVEKNISMDEEQIKRVMGNMLSVLEDQNATAEALRSYFSLCTDMKMSFKIPFSSERKYSGVCFEEKGTFLLGAAQFLFPEQNEKLLELCNQYGEDGKRVLVLAYSPEIITEAKIPDPLFPKALLLLTDVIRKEAPDTLAYFAKQGVNCKVISGDDPITVASIAKRAGLDGAEKYIDASTLQTKEELQAAVEEYQVFGRVTPQQKKEMVIALKQKKHVVAMTGDGVNDVLALKESDCSIAMASGSSAAKNIANIVLLTSDFSAMPLVVNQGRKVINNIRMAASMFLVKTFFSIFLALIAILIPGSIYPFEPIQMSLISFCAVGAPTFLLAQEGNYDKVGTSFLRHVLMNALPAALTITGCVFTIMMVSENIYHSSAMLSTACVLVTGWNYMATLKTVYHPLNAYRKVIIYGMQLIFFGAAVVLQKLLCLGSLEFGMIILVFVLMTFAPLVIEGITFGLRSLTNKIEKRKEIKRQRKLEKMKEKEEKAKEKKDHKGIFKNRRK